jgi:hypothetical protein
MLYLGKPVDIYLLLIRPDVENTMPTKGLLSP